MNTDAPSELMPLASARRLLALLALSGVLLIAGLWLPMLTLTKFLFIANSFSVISGVMELFRHEQWFLFLVVGLFSVILPLLKIMLLYLLLRHREVRSPRTGRLLKLMHDYGRWAMLDVMVVAVLIVTVKLGVVAQVEIHPGLYLFATAGLLIMVITHRIVSHLEGDQA